VWGDEGPEDRVVATVAVAVGLFAGTNVDDLLVLAVLFLACRGGGPLRAGQVWAGQAAGFTVLVLAALLAALGLTVVPGRWVALLGLVPLGAGVLGLVRAVRAHRDGRSAPVAPVPGVVSVALLTVVDGADNLTVYPPVFRTLGTGALLVTLAVFALGVPAWCLIGSRLAAHRTAVALVERWGEWLVPAVFLVIGAVMLAG
jgi:cadmium resistance protein CadD (predicted permease)